MRKEKKLFFVYRKITANGLTRYAADEYAEKFVPEDRNRRYHKFEKKRAKQIVERLKKTTPESWRDRIEYGIVPVEI